jgi:hypothetical protein
MPKPLMLLLGRISHGIMEVKMLRGIKRRAENRERQDGAYRIPDAD